MFFKKKQANSVQELIGFEAFGRNGVLIKNKGELVFFTISPTNISVLSQDNISLKVKDLMTLLSTQPDIAICCMDDNERFDDNNEYLKQRMREETNHKVKALLQADLNFLDEISLQMSTARRFMFIVRLRNESEEQSFSNLNRIEKAITDFGFEVHRADKKEIKRFLAIYFQHVSLGDTYPDIDGEQWVI